MIKHTDKSLELLWDELENVLFIEEQDSNELVLNEEWLHFDAGTDTESIWHWFDELHSKGVAYLMFTREEN